jgi:hypothetical protein
MLGLFPRFKRIAFPDHVEVRHAPVMGPVDLLAPADDVRRRELGVLEDRLQMLAVPTDMGSLFFRDQYSIQEFFRA